MPARSSTPAGRHGAWRSLVAHLLWEQRVGGSNPSAPTNSGGGVVPDTSFTGQSGDIVNTFFSKGLGPGSTRDMADAQSPNGGTASTCIMVGSWL